MVTVPGHLELLAVDGRAVPDYLLQSATFDYLLLPGERSLTVRYDSLWAGGLRANARRVSSAPQVLTVNVLERTNYRLSSASKPTTVSEAKAFASCPHLWLENAAGEPLARAQPEVSCSPSD
ncbi:MAG: DUF2057 domain-containing protein [Halomonadaceae bacterium]|nr:MAG: DUF2057 domain-containing protein [Halomonadaceae bacterium]